MGSEVQLPLFLKNSENNIFPITDERMTRFMINLEEGVKMVWHAFEDMLGGEIYVKKIKSMKITDIAKTINPNAKFSIIGIRPGEKLHEQMIGIDDAPHTYEYDEYFKVLPAINNWSMDENRINSGKLVAPEFSYSSDINNEWMSSEELKKWINNNYPQTKI